MAYDDSNRAFLQAFMARSTLTLTEAKPILAAIYSIKNNQETSPDEITPTDLETYIAAANSAISPFDLEIRSLLPQLELDPTQDNNAHTPPERIYALVNTTSDALTQLATTHSADEIAFVKRLLDAMFETNNTRRQEAMVVSSMQALQLAKVVGGRESMSATQGAGGAAQSLTMTQAETMLRQLVEEGWLEKSRRGFYRLSPRGLMELKGWLVATYNDEGVRKIKFCEACRDVITAGQRCAERDCPGRLHDHCMRNFFRMQKAEVCPVCKIPWPGDRFVGERAITREQSAQRSRRAANTQVEAGPSTQVEVDGLDADLGEGEGEEEGE
ncbi:non-structural maintenance of chromosomes element 1 family protein [Aspergillus ibericus CBS 121593]|uniref:Non-structural maintenance of chromosomes element 1 homolog n=1 Tax=Aspergillus ibericus CBS 121593 TaxID=1448316 RepID=A0A395H9E1_9EURO|nr:DNA repair protein [Aspergillus ibericus CBS 121593]RAL04472.1 DNA repair protein [Aspergillus ibericus CBS 121593]